MSPNEVVVAGTLRADGTLDLDERPNLAPGRVVVVLRSDRTPEPPPTDWWHYLQRVRAEYEAAGHAFLTERQMMAHIDELRADDDRIDRLHDEIERHRRERP
jgi:transposase